jgi:sugar/nucleoside kinase (ribokinase family)
MAMNRPDPAPRVVCIGHATLDAILAVPRLPASDERLPAASGALAGGGPAATAAVALARLGIAVAFGGRTGDDAPGRLIREGLLAEGVDVSALDVVPGSSPFTAVLVDPDGGRALIPAPGGLPPLRLTAGLEALVRGAAWVHLDHVGAALLPAIRALAGPARISVDGGNPIEGLVLDGVDLYAPTTRALLARMAAPDLDEALEAALREGAALVVATDGARGAHAAWRDAAGHVRRSTVPAPRVEGLVSTLGAGDVFHGALLAALVEGREVEDALAFANGVAAASTRALDGRTAIPRRDELDALPDRHELRAPR